MVSKLTLIINLQTVPQNQAEMIEWAQYEISQTKIQSNSQNKIYEKPSIRYTLISTQTEMAN